MLLKNISLKLIDNQKKFKIRGITIDQLLIINQILQAKYHIFENSFQFQKSLMTLESCLTL